MNWDSPAIISDFSLASNEEDGEGGPVLSHSTLQLSAKVFGPAKSVLMEIDNQVANMLNYLFRHGLREDDHKALCEDELVLHPTNCPALAPVDCNPQILDALRGEAKKMDFRLKEINKDCYDCYQALAGT